MSILTVENVSHSYGEKTILYNACFRLLKGEHVGLVGKMELKINIVKDFNRRTYT